MSQISDSAPPPDTSRGEQPEGTEDPPPPIKGLKRLMISIVPANIVVFMIWGAVPGILLPQQITEVFGEAGQANVKNLALVATIGAFGAMIAQPIAGQLSDRTRSRFGRRAPWILLGALMGALALIGLALANTLVGFILAWTLVQVGFNVAQGPLSAVLPDRVPQARRGSFSAVFGIGMMVGGLGGGIVGSMLFHSIALGYVNFAVLSVLALAGFVALNPDHPSSDLEPDPFDLRGAIATFWVNPVKHPDFFWAFTGRLLLYTAYFLIIGYQLYMLQYYFKVQKPETVIPVLGLLSLVGMLVAIAVSGPLSDKVGRRKPFVFCSAAVVSLSFLLPWLWADVTAWMSMTFTAALGFGMFQAVDTALISEVLPSASSFGKDLGVVNIAATLPQTVAPGVAGILVLSVGYGGLFPVAIVVGILGGCAIAPIKSVR